MWKEKEEDRFEKTYLQGNVNIIEIWVDKQTGVQYLFRYSGSAGGLTPLLDADGKPQIDPNYRKTL